MKSESARGRQRLDMRLLPLKPVEKLKTPPQGWIRAIREALGMTGVQLARRMSVSPPTLKKIEKSEATGSIQISTLRRAAEALNCTVVYALVPNDSLVSAVDQRARKIALRELGRVAHSMKLEAQGTDEADLEDQIRSYIRENLKDRDLWNEP
jgi:predicted DNA-binding mobile mystery protein A